MTEEDIKKMNKSELLETALDQAQEIELLQQQNARLKKKLSSRQLNLQESGNIAEASLKITGIFEDAQKAAQLYIDNTRKVNETAKAKADEYYTQQKTKADDLMSKAAAESKKMVYDSKKASQDELAKAKEEAVKILSESKIKASQIEETSRQKCKLQEENMAAQCDKMLQQAKKESAAYWDNVRVKIEAMISEHDDLKGLLSGFARSAGEQGGSESSGEGKSSQG